MITLEQAVAKWMQEDTEAFLLKKYLAGNKEPLESLQLLLVAEFHKVLMEANSSTLFRIGAEEWQLRRNMEQARFSGMLELVDVLLKALVKKDTQNA